MNRPKSGWVTPRKWVACVALLCAELLGCATIPKGQYGVKEIEWVGAKELDGEAAASCLVTRERQAVNLMLGISAPTCGEPPFDSSPPTIDLWTLPWTDWPIFDPAIFEVERERIERWYAARGYYDAKVTDVKTFADGKEVDPEECKGEGSQCELKLVVTLKEGKPSYVEKVELKTDAPLPDKLLERMRKALQLRAGHKIDEYYYEADKKRLEEMLLEASYARSKVSGRVLVDRNKRTAYVEYQLQPGPPCVFGSFRVEGQLEDVPVGLIHDAASIPTGEKYDQEVVDDAQRSIFALNVFSSVRIERRGDGKVVDLVAIVQRGRITTWSAGLGMMSGTMVRPTQALTESVPQWDVHVSATYENRNFLGGLRRLRIEERPRLIFRNQFPIMPTGGPVLGNIINVRFEQPSTFERRTKLVVSSGWDFGPDPFADLDRHDVQVKVGLERPFWKHKLLGRIAIAHDVFAITEGQGDGYSSYRFPYLEQQLIVDLRDDPARPRLGVYFSLLLQESARLNGYASWNYFRMIPDARVYLPMPWSIVLAARFALGANFVWSPAPGLDDRSARLGPQNYRLRGGGAGSNRGFLAGRLGDSEYGGTRRWEGSLELRVPIGGDFGVVFFGDVGDVSDSTGEVSGALVPLPAFEFNRLNLATGFGLRYFSVLGAIRLDAGWRIPGAQTIGVADDGVKLGPAPSAVHFTIGEAF
jgi:outer membrane protein assembly factor BamA